MVILGGWAFLTSEVTLYPTFKKLICQVRGTDPSSFARKRTIVTRNLSIQVYNCDYCVRDVHETCLKSLTYWSESTLSS